MTRPGVTRRLAGFAVEFDRADIPERTRRAAVRTVTNAVSLAVGSSRSPACEIALETLEKLGHAGDVSLLGREERLGLTSAPLVTGVAIHVEDFDDAHLTTVVHPAAPVVPAALAVAEYVGASGADLVDAVTVGVEVSLRVGLGLGKGHFDRGWHVTGTAGHLGAAAAAGRLLGLDVARMVVALGVASTEAAGLQEAFGTMTKSFHAGKAAADGVEAALLAKHGFTGPVAPIEGRRGLAAVAGGGFDPDQIVTRLGERWEIDANAIKPYACGIVSHAAIDAAIALRGDCPEPDRIASVELRVNPVVLDVMGVSDPQDGLAAKFSVYHCFAVGLLDGSAGPPQYTTDRARADDVVALRRKVHVRLDPAVRRDEAWARVVDVTGDVHERHVGHATGSIERPMSDAALRAKCVGVALPVLGDGTAAFVDAAFDVDGLPSVAALTRLSVPRPAVAPSTTDDSAGAVNSRRAAGSGR
ncbi:MAG: MmgE/PrpD family protein [Acidothermales bacterium]|nr:MmgE/PrpD family protein [Acidothermales bacterium]